MRWICGISIVLVSISTVRAAEVPRVLPPGELPADRRLEPLRSLHESYFPMRPVVSVDDWHDRKAELRRQVRVALGLWPPPTRTPLEAVVHSPVERGDYTVWRVYFQSMPGHYVTGSLYRPKNRDGPLPAVLSPHGHWGGGRFHRFNSNELRSEIAIGAERFLSGGQTPLQARCVQLARMGCVVFQYDMVGYADSIQIGHQVGPRPHVGGLFSPSAELELQSMMGLQTWNSIRALDFLYSLPEVDPERVVVNGASSGGTQTLMLVAVDDRPCASIPFVMVSTAMQGGCHCENACYLRIGAGNVDIAALAAPRPLAINAADDWTRQVEHKGYPDLQSLYRLLGMEDRLRAAFHTQFRHNYNSVNRTFMYDCVNDFLDLGLETPILERDYVPLTRDELTVWTAGHPAPSGEQIGEPHELALLKWWTDDVAGQKKALGPSGYRQLLRDGWDAIIGRRLADVGDIQYSDVDNAAIEGFEVQRLSVNHTAAGERLPTIVIEPKIEWNRGVVLWLTDRGKVGLVGENGALDPTVRQLLDAGYAVAGVDLLYQGEFLAEGGTLTHTRMNLPDGEHAATAAQYPVEFTFGYNRPLICQRVHDVLTMVKAIQTDPRGVERVYVVGDGREAGPIALAAHAQADGAIERTAWVASRFRFENVTRVDDPMFVPGAARYDGVDGLVALCGKGNVRLLDDTDGLLDWLME